MKPGAIVQYAKPEAGEQDLRFVIIEERGARVLIASLDFPDWRIAPQEVVLAADVIEVSAKEQRRALMAQRDRALRAGEIAEFQRLTLEIAKLPMPGIPALSQADIDRFNRR